jgi:hypothetical protein
MQVHKGMNVFVVTRNSWFLLHDNTSAHRSYVVKKYQCNGSEAITIIPTHVTT